MDAKLTQPSGTKYLHDNSKLAFSRETSKHTQLITYADDMTITATNSNIQIEKHIPLYLHSIHARTKLNKHILNSDRKKYISDS